MKLSVKSFLKVSDTMEKYMKLAVVILFFGWNVIEGAVFENESTDIIIWYNFKDK